MDMRFHWLRDHECQQQFRIYWRPCKMNYADYWTKHHPESHHKNMCKEFLTPEQAVIGITEAKAKDSGSCGHVGCVCDGGDAPPHRSRPRPPRRGVRAGRCCPHSTQIMGRTTSSLAWRHPPPILVITLAATYLGPDADTSVRANSTSIIITTSMTNNILTMGRWRDTAYGGNI